MTRQQFLLSCQRIVLTGRLWEAIRRKKWRYGYVIATELDELDRLEEAERRKDEQRTAS